MDKKKIKRIIAREGIILTGIIIIILLLINYEPIRNFIRFKFGFRLIPEEQKFIDSMIATTDLKGLLDLTADLINRRIKIVVFFVILLLYFLFRFIIWALRTLRER